MCLCGVSGWLREAPFEEGFVGWAFIMTVENLSSAAVCGKVANIKGRVNTIIERCCPLVGLRVDRLWFKTTSGFEEAYRERTQI